MIIRQLKEEDIPELFDIHRRFYEQEFPFPLVNGRPLSTDKFVVTDDYDKIITFGTLELNTEAILITDKSQPWQERWEALQKLFIALRYVTGNNGFDMLHCTVQDKNWEDILKKYGFRNCKGNYLYYRV